MVGVRVVGIRVDGSFPVRELDLGVDKLEKLSSDIWKVTKELLSKIDPKLIHDLQAGEPTQ